MRLLSALMLTQALSATIIETDTIADVLEHVDHNTWVCLDLDNTVYQSETEVGHADWIQNEVNARVAKGMSREEAFYTLYPAWKKAQQECKVVPIEKQMIEQIATWQEQGITVMGITHRQLFIIPETFQQLTDLGLDLKKTAPSSEPFDLLATCPGHYRDGVLFCNDFNNKGEMFLQYLSRTQHKPKKVVFVDDRKHNVEEMQAVCEANGMECVGVFYTGMEKVGSNYKPHHLYKIVSRQTWEKSLLEGKMQLTSFDEPFIHLATDAQVEKVLEKFWQGKEAIILRLERNALQGELVLESNPGGTTRYYHLYNGSIPMEAISDVTINSVVRAAIDFGSGTLKITAAKLHGEAPIPLYTTYETLNLSEDVHAAGGIISEAMQQLAGQTLERFQQEVAQLANGERIEYQGIATAVFRKASNGEQVLQQFEEQLGIPFKILPQSEEGALGYLTAKVVYPEKEVALAWDSGNGSYQLSTSDKMYGGPIGHGTVRAWLAEKVRRSPLLTRAESGNPITLDEAKKLRGIIQEALEPHPKWVAGEPLTFGDGQSIFALSSLALNGKEIIELPELEQALTALAGKTDEELAALGLHKKTVSSLIHLASMMEHFAFERVHYRRSTGTTPGMLISETLW